MGIVFSYFKHTPVGSTDTNTIHDSQSILVRRQMEAKTSSIKIELPNRFSKYSTRGDSSASLFSEEDEIQIYANNEAINEDNNLVINATVKEFAHRFQPGRKSISVTGMDRTYVLLNKIYLGGGFDNDATPTEAIVKIINWVSDKAEGRHPGITTGNVATIPTHRVDNTDGTVSYSQEGTFNNITLHLVNKTAYEWIQEISKQPKYTVSGTTYTSDRDFIFWVDEGEDFHWIYPSQATPTGDNVITVGNSAFEITKSNFKKSIFDIVNMVIYNAGDDPAGNGIQWYFYDQNSKQPELRMKFTPMLDIARDTQANEKTLTTFTGEYPSSYPYTTSWNEEVDNDAKYLGSLIKDVSGNGTAIFGEGNGSGFRGQCRFLADKRALSVTNQTGALRWRGQLVMKGTTSYNPGDLLQITHKEANMIEQKLRCKLVEHQIGKNGWFTTLGLEEDNKAVII